MAHWSRDEGGVPEDLQMRAERRSTWTSAGLGWAGFVVATGAYLIGAGRSYAYDESVTVGAFVNTPSLLDPFRRQIVFNNHPFFSFLEHLVWDAGGRSETWMRVLPAAAGAAAVGMVAWAVCRRWGLLAGAAAAGTLATSPLFVEASRTVRGYSLLTLCAVASTVLAVDLVEQGERRLQSVAYVVAAAAGGAVHLYMAPVVGAHVAFVAARGRPIGRMWRIRWYAAGLLGALSYLGIAGDMAAASQGRGRDFDPSFPGSLGRALLGTHPLAVGLLGAVVAVAAWITRSRRDLTLPATAVAMFTTVAWVLLAPLDLYPRFFVWLAPGVALAAAVAVRWKAALIVPAVLSMAVTAGDQVRSWRTDDRSIPNAALAVEQARRAGDVPCAIGGEALLAYTAPPTEVVPTDLTGCDVLVIFGAVVEARYTSAFSSDEYIGRGPVRVLRR